MRRESTGNATITASAVSLRRLSHPSAPARAQLQENGRSGSCQSQACRVVAFQTQAHATKPGHRHYAIGSDLRECRCCFSFKEIWTSLFTAAAKDKGGASCRTTFQPVRDHLAPGRDHIDHSKTPIHRYFHEHYWGCLFPVHLSP